MTRTVPSPPAGAGAAPGDRREIGPIGTAARVVGGAIAIALPIALVGLGWWDAAAALLALPLVATAAAALITSTRRVAPRALARRDAICSGLACSLIVVEAGAAAGLDALTPARSEVALPVWLGASMLVAAARGYGGCEVLALPNVMTGRRDHVGCVLYTPIDRAEARRRANRPGHPAAARR